ncbi:hypothetical protein PG989_016271 [Apiospora arundinis]
MSARPATTRTSRTPTAIVEAPTTTVTPTTDRTWRTDTLEPPTGTITPPYVSSTTAPPSSSTPPNGGSGDLSPEGKIGLGLGLGIGIPLLALLGLGCFFLWRLWGRQEKTVQGQDGQRDKNSTTEAGGAKELDSAQIYEADGKQWQKPPPARELQSIEIHEAEGEGRGVGGGR